MLLYLKTKLTYSKILDEIKIHAIHKWLLWLIYTYGLCLNSIFSGFFVRKQFSSASKTYIPFIFFAVAMTSLESFMIVQPLRLNCTVLFPFTISLIDKRFAVKPGTCKTSDIVSILSFVFNLIFPLKSLVNVLPSAIWISSLCSDIIFPASSSPLSYGK